MDPGVALLGVLACASCLHVEGSVALRVTKVHVGSLHKRRDLLKLIKSVVLVVLNDAREDLSQVAVEVAGHGALIVGRRVQLLFDFLQRFGTQTHST